MKQIVLLHGELRKLKTAFNTSYVTVKRALSYQTNTELAKKIRFTAIKEFGGAIVEKKSLSKTN